MAALLAAEPLYAQSSYLPTMKVLDGPAIDPTSAATYFQTATSTGTTIGPLPTPPEIVELARGLGAADVPTNLAASTYAERAYEYVRQNVDTEFNFGLQKGALGAVEEQSGTAFDQSSLLVALLAQANISATYQFGKITLTAQQVQDWTGLTNATAACKLFANGGIPVTINGSNVSNCAVSGNVSSAVVSHVWVAALGNLYDPAFKRYHPTTGVDVAQAMGCGTAQSPTCGSSAITAATPAASGDQSPIGGAPAWRNVQSSNLANKLTQYGSALESYIKTNLPNAVLANVIGGSSIDWSSLQTAGTSLPYTFTLTSSWTVIPDSFRTTLRVQFDNIDKTLFVDELYGGRLKIFGLMGSGGPPAQRQVALYLDYRALASSTRPDGTLSNDTLTLSVNHPYAASGGTYGDEVVSLDTYAQVQLCGPPGCQNVFSPLTIIHGWGDTGPAAVKRQAALEAVDVSQLNFTNPTDPNALLTLGTVVAGGTATGLACDYAETTGDYVTPVYNASGSNVRLYPPCLALHQDTQARNWMLQDSRASKVIGAINSVFVHTHHILGWVASCITCGTSMSVEYTRSVYSSTASTTDRQAAIYSLAAVSSRLEGSIAEQQFDAFDGISAISLAHRANDQSIPLMELAASNYSTSRAQLQNYPASVLSYFDTYVPTPNNYVFVVPQNYALGPISLPEGIPYQITLGGYSGFSPAGDHITYAVGADALKGAGAIAAPDDPQKDALQATSLQDHTLKQRKVFTVDAATGVLNVAPPPDLKTGNGKFPYALEFRRRYSSALTPPANVYQDCENLGLGGGTTCFPWKDTSVEPGAAALGYGWTHNLQVSASMASNVVQALGQDSALDAAGSIAALYTLRTLYLGTQTQPSLVTGMFVADWWANSLRNDAVIVQRGSQSQTFMREPDGTFNPPADSAAVLTQSGTWSGPYAGVGGAIGYDYQGVTFALTLEDGSTIALSSNFPIAIDGGSGLMYGVGLRSFKADSWTFPTGVTVSFAYTTPAWVNNSGQWTQDNACLTKVSNNLGRALNVTAPYLKYSMADVCLIQTVTDETGSQSFTWTPGTNLTAQTIDGATTTYAYLSKPFPAGPANVFTLQSITMPGDGSAFETVAYDSLYHVKTTTDALGNITSYYSAGFSSEQLGRGEMKDPIGAYTTTYKNFFGHVLQEIDPLSNVTSYTYDGRQRLQSKVFPELNYENYAYDVRSNLLSTTRYPKPGSSLVATTTSTTYNEGQTVFPCVRPNTCNKPLYEYDAKNNQTTYAWNTNGTLSSVTYPNVVDGSTTVGAPYTSYGYSSYGLVNLKTQRVWQNPSIVNLVTQYNYNTSVTTFPLTSVVVDYGGKNLTTLYTFDNGGTGPGNVTSITDPDSNVTGYKYDVRRRLKEIDAPLNATTLYTYDMDGQLTSTQKYDSTRSAYQTEVKYYYPTGDLAYVVQPDADPTAPAQGTSTTVTTVPCPSSYVTCYSYDADGRVLATTEPLMPTTNRVSANAYDLDGRRLCSWRGFGTTASAITQVTGSTPCAWTPSSYTQTSALRYDLLAYSANGKVNQSTDSDGNLTTLVYDGFDRLSQMILPGTTPGTAAPCHTTYTAGDNCEQYGYDNNDNRQTKINRSGNTISYSFDAMNQEYQRQVPANSNGHFTRTLTETYDLLGHKYLATADSQTLTFNRDTATRLSSVVDTILGTVGYSYDAASNRTQVTWPDNYIATYAYDALNRLCKVKENTATTCATNDSISSLIVQYTWDTLSRRQTVAFGNTVTTGLSYFDDSALKGITHTIGAKSVGLTYTRNQVNQLATQTLAITDPTGVLNPESFILEPSSANSTAYVPNNLNEYGTVGGVTNAFDLNGNLTSDGTYSYEYDEENRLRSATGAGNTITYDYDPLGRRRAKTVNGTMTRFLSDDQEEIGEYTGAATPALLRRYINGPSVDEHLVQIEAGGTHYYFQTNHQGTTLLTSDSSSTPVLASFNYGAYGDSTSPITGAAFRYTGRRLDPETGLYYYRARYYSPTLGRFLQTDPIGSKNDLNLYAYVVNDPLDNTDPRGESECAVTGPDTMRCTSQPGLDHWLLHLWLRFHGYIVTSQSHATSEQSQSNDGAPSGSDSETKEGQAKPSAGSENSTTKRPSRVRKGTEQSNWDNAKDGPNGGKECPTCGDEVSSKPGEKHKDWDNDHDPAWRNRDLRGRDRKQVLDEYNRDTRLRCTRCNRSDNGSGDQNDE